MRRSSLQLTDALAARMILAARASLTTTASKRDRMPAAAAHLPGLGRWPVKVAGNGIRSRGRHMPAVLAKPTKQNSTPPAPSEPAIDVAHLGRMTFGERSLEPEVLRLFDRQAGMLLARMQAAAPDTVGSFAHTLKGWARGSGAWQVAQAAEAVELAASAGDAAALRGALATLAAAVTAARTAITELCARR